MERLRDVLVSVFVLTLLAAPEMLHQAFPLHGQVGLRNRYAVPQFYCGTVPLPYIGAQPPAIFVVGIRMPGRVHFHGFGWHRQLGLVPVSFWAY